MSRTQLSLQILKGNKKAAAQLITLLERRSPEAAEEMKMLLPRTGKAHRIGVTGAQGVGKSSLIDQLIPLALKRNKLVGVIAVDPTSPLSGGAFLGDRIRMQRHAAHPGVFIRSMAARGHRGGLSPALHDAIRVMEATGCNPIFVETVGVGQDEIDITRATDTTLLLLTPQSGDKIQALKAGLLEAADLLVLNKSELPGAQNLFEALRGIVKTPSVTVSAATGKGLEELYGKIEEFHQKAEKDGTAALRRRTSLREEILQKAEELLCRELASAWKTPKAQTALNKELKKKQTADETAKKVLKSLRGR